MCPFEAFLLGVVPSVVRVVVMITGTALGTVLVQVIRASPVPVCTGVPVFCVVCFWAEAAGDLRGGRGEISVLTELPVRDSGTSWVWDDCVMDLDLLYSMLKYIYIYILAFQLFSIQWLIILFLSISVHACVFTESTVHVYPRLTSRWILVCLYLLFLLLRTLLLYGGCLLSFGWICLSSLLLTLLYACIYFTYVSTRIIYVVSKCYASWCNVYSFLLTTQLESCNWRKRTTTWHSNSRPML